MLAVVRASSPEHARSSVDVARRTLADKGCELLGVVASRVPPESVGDVAAALQADDGVPVYVIAEHPELAQPSVGEIAAALGAEPIVGGDQELQREVRDVRVAAMGVEHFLADLVEGTLVIVPGDRADILVASLASALAPDVPAVAGLVLTGEHEPDPAVLKLLAGAPFPVFRVPERTFAVAAKVNDVRSVITAADERKTATALGRLRARRSTRSSSRRHLRIERPKRLTPAMFEYELIERAKEFPQHIVLPEGDDDRVLRAADILLRRGVVQLTILGEPDAVSARASALGLDLGAAHLVDPQSSPQRTTYAERLHELRKHRGMTEEQAFETAGDET